MHTEIFKNKSLPNYHIRYCTTKDLKEFAVYPFPIIEAKDDNEFGLGRFWCIKDGGTFKVWYSIRRRHRSYRSGYAESLDSIHWERRDEEVGIYVSESGWDSEMICYPAVIKVKNKTYLFYNGNNNGSTGFGYAELEE